MKLEAKPCPCGCRKFIVTPLFGSVDASLYKEEADELVRRWNAFEPKFAPGNYVPDAAKVTVPPTMAGPDEYAAPPGKYFASIGAKGGKKKGPTKKRGGANHYRDMVQKRWDKPNG